MLATLGAWQLQRGLQKAEIERVRAEPHHSTLARAPQNWRDLAYRRVTLHGEWRAQIFLRDNRVHNRRRGYEVLHAFRLSGGGVVLVNRGWVESAPSPPALQNVSAAEVRGEITLPEKGFTLGESYRAQTGWPKVIQYFDIDALQKLMPSEQTLQPAVLLLDAAHPSAFTQLPRAAAFRPARHYGYAAQWWGLAVTLLVFGAIWRRMRRGGARAH